MNKKLNILIIAAFGMIPLFAAAQNLSKEITVQKDYVPTERKATKANDLPKVKKEQSKTSALNYSNWAAPTQVPAKIQVLTPYGYETTHDFSTQRGYFDLGAGSFMNVVGSAGYRILDTEQTTLGFWLQHNSTWTGKNNSPVNTIDHKQKYNENRIGVDLTSNLAPGTLTANVFYHFDHFNYYGGNSDIWEQSAYKQTVNEVNLRLGWKNHATPDALSYHANLLGDYFGYSHSLVGESYKGAKETHLQLNLGGEYLCGEYSHAGVDLSGDWVHYSKLTAIDFDQQLLSPHSNKSLGMVTLSPYFRYNHGNFALLLGVKADGYFDGNSSFQIAPNVEFSYAFIDGVTFYANAKGGKSLNLAADRANINRYADPSSMLLGGTFSPIDAEGGFKVGPFAGFSLKLFGGYGKFKNMPLPWIPVLEEAKESTVATYYRPISIDGWKLGAEATYKFRSLVEFKAGITYSDQDKDNGYVLGEDRAKCVATASINVTPIKPLTIGIGYELRAKRAVRSVFYSGSAPVIESWVKTPLDDVNLLRAGASYKINDMFGVFVQANNILGKKWDDYFGMSAQRFNALGGISIVF